MTTTTTATGAARPRPRAAQVVGRTRVVQDSLDPEWEESIIVSLPRFGGGGDDDGDGISDAIEASRATPCGTRTGSLAT